MRYLLALACIALPSSGSGQKPAEPKKQAPKFIEFTHEGCAKTGDECRLSYALTLKDGEEFLVKLKKTRPSEFNYDVAGIKLAAPEKATTEAGELEDKEIAQRHDKQFGGYLVTIRRKAEVEKSALPNATLVISVTTAKWNLAFGGGFPITTLTDRKFSLRDTTVGGAAKFQVLRDKDHEDKVALSTATFIHLSHSNVPSWAATFGLGVGGTTQYFVGPSLMFGDLGALTVGVAFGGRDELPAGLSDKGITGNANALTTLPKRNGVGGFVAFSFSFLGTNHSPFEKPFKGDEGGGAAAPAGPAAGGGEKSKLAAPAEVVAGAAFDITVTLCAETGKTAPKEATYSGQIAEPFERADDGKIVTKKAGNCFQGTFKAKAKAGTAAGKHKPKVTVDGSGLTAELTGEEVTIKPAP